MRTRNLLPAFALASVFAGSAMAQTYVVNITAPGGHSFGSYGNTNAVHAAANAIREIARTVPEAVVSDFNGGATVNAIATDATFRVTVPDSKDLRTQIEKAVETGVKREKRLPRREGGRPCGGRHARARALHDQVTDGHR